MKIDGTRQAAPSFTALRIAGLGTPKKGQVPTMRAIIATDLNGRTWQHQRLFRGSEFEALNKLQKAIEQRGEINPAHWRLTHREY